jgi:hypothetical protein
MFLGSSQVPEHCRREQSRQFVNAGGKQTAPRSQSEAARKTAAASAALSATQTLWSGRVGFYVTPAQ